MNKTTPIIVIVIVAIAVVVGFFVSRSGNGESDMANTIVIVPHTGTGTFWELVRKGAEKAVEESEYTVVLQAPSGPNDVQGQVRIVRNLAVQGVAGFVVAPIEISALSNVVQETSDANTPCVLICARDPEPGGLLTMGPDEYMAGVMAARSLGRSLAGSGRIVLVNYDKNCAPTARCETGFADTIKNEFSQIQVLKAVYGGPSSDSALEATRELLMRDPTITGLFASREATSIGALKAIQGQGLEGKVKMVGFGSDQTLIDGLKSGTVISLVSRNPYKMGYEATNSVIALRQGAQVEPVHLDTGVKLITASNLSDPEVKTLLMSE